jgi:hypothetical protein
MRSCAPCTGVLECPGPALWGTPARIPGGPAQPHSRPIISVSAKLIPRDSAIDISMPLSALHTCDCRHDRVMRTISVPGTGTVGQIMPGGSRSGLNVESRAAEHTASWLRRFMRPCLRPTLRLSDPLSLAAGACMSFSKLTSNSGSCHPTTARLPSVCLPHGHAEPWASLAACRACALIACVPQGVNLWQGSTTRGGDFSHLELLAQAVIGDVHGRYRGEQRGSGGESRRGRRRRG